MLQCPKDTKDRSVLRFILGEILRLLMLGVGMSLVIPRTEILLICTILILGDTLRTGTGGTQDRLQCPYTKQVNHTHLNHMEDTLWSEIADAPGEIFDIPEMMDEEEDSTFASKLHSNFDF